MAPHRGQSSWAQGSGSRLVSSHLTVCTLSPRPWRQNLAFPGEGRAPAFLPPSSCEMNPLALSMGSAHASSGLDRPLRSTGSWERLAEVRGGHPALRAFPLLVAWLLQLGVCGPTCISGICCSSWARPEGWLQFSVAPNALGQPSGTLLFWKSLDTPLWPGRLLDTPAPSQLSLAQLLLRLDCQTAGWKRRPSHPGGAGACVKACFTAFLTPCAPLLPSSPRAFNPGSQAAPSAWAPTHFLRPFLCSPAPPFCLLVPLRMFLASTLWSLLLPSYPRLPFGEEPVGLPAPSSLCSHAARSVAHPLVSSRPERLPTASIFALVSTSASQRSHLHLVLLNDCDPDLTFLSCPLSHLAPL